MSCSPLSGPHLDTDSEDEAGGGGGGGGGGGSVMKKTAVQVAGESLLTRLVAAVDGAAFSFG